MKNITDNEVTERISIKLKLERIRHGYTLQQVADFTGIDTSDLSKFERGKVQINFRNLNVLFHFYEIDFEYFFGDFNSFDLEKSRNLVSRPCKN